MTPHIINAKAQCTVSKNYFQNKQTKKPEQLNLESDTFCFSFYRESIDTANHIVCPGQL